MEAAMEELVYFVPALVGVWAYGVWKIINWNRKVSSRPPTLFWRAWWWCGYRLGLYRLRSWFRRWLPVEMRPITENEQYTCPLCHSKCPKDEWDLVHELCKACVLRGVMRIRSMRGDYPVFSYTGEYPNSSEDYYQYQGEAPSMYGGTSYVQDISVEDAAESIKEVVQRTREDEKPKERIRVIRFKKRA
jgi:hypothetical protein